MKQVKILYLKYVAIFVLSCFAMSNSFAQCYEREMEPTQFKQIFAANGLTVSDKYQAIIKLDKVLKYDKYLIENKSNSDSIRIETYSSDPCSSNNSLSEYFINDTLTIFLSEDIDYLKLTTKNKNQSTFSIQSFINQREVGCHFKINKFNSIDYPTILDNLQIGTNCFDFCNAYCKRLPSKYDLKREFSNSSIKWFKIPVGINPLILKIKFSSNELSNPILLEYGVKNESTFYKGKKDLRTQDQILQYYDLDYILLGVFDKNGIEGNFNLCFQKFANGDSCIDFFEGDGQILKAIYTSKGSPLDGPFQHGELVTFNYKLINWMPIKDTWLHGIQIDLGTGWKGLLKDSLNGTPLRIKQLDNGSIDTSEVIKILDYIITDTFRIEGYEVNNLTTPAWYVDPGTRGPMGPSPNYRWGSETDRYRGSVDSPIFQYDFTAIADSLIDCRIPLDGSITVNLTTDNQTGYWGLNGCSEDIPLTKEAQILCCEDLGDLRLQDTTLCAGEYFNFSNLTKDSFEFTIVNIPENEYGSKRSFDQGDELLLINAFKEPDTLEVYATFQNEICPIQLSFLIIVKSKFAVGDLNISDLCLGDRVNISEISENHLQDNFDIQINDELIKHFDLDADGIIWKSPTENFSTKLIIDSKYYCSEEIKLGLEAGACEDDTQQEEIDFNFTFYPNPSAGPIQIDIVNNTAYTQWYLSIFDQKGFKIYSNQIYVGEHSSLGREIDLSFLKNANYVISISNEYYALAKYLNISQ